MYCTSNYLNCSFLSYSVSQVVLSTSRQTVKPECDLYESRLPLVHIESNQLREMINMKRMNRC